VAKVRTIVNIRQARKIGNRQRWRRRGAPALPVDQTSYSPAQLMAAATLLYRSWRRACPLRANGSRSTGLELRHGDFFGGNRVASLHDRGYYVRGEEPPRSAYDERAA
jgi:hypothetical protein